MRILENISMITLLVLLTIVGIALMIFMSPIVYVITGTVGTIEFYKGIIGGIRVWGKEKR